MESDRYISYLLRLWLEKQAGGEGESPAWQGEVLHIQSGSKVSFQDMTDCSISFENRLREMAISNVESWLPAVLSGVELVHERGEFWSKN